MGKNALQGQRIKQLACGMLKQERANEFKGYTILFSSVAFSPDSRTVLTGSNDGKPVYGMLKQENCYRLQKTL